MRLITIVLWIHLISAMFWVGGQLFLVGVVVPALRGALQAEERVRLTALVGRRFLLTSWVVLALLVASGIANAVLRNVTWTTFKDTDFGHVLGVKIVLVAIMLGLSAVHGLYYGGRLEELARQSGADPRAGERRRALQRRSVRLSAVNLFLNLVIVLLAARLAT